MDDDKDDDLGLKLLVRSDDRIIYAIHIKILNTKTENNRTAHLYILAKKRKGQNKKPLKEAQDNTF